MKIQVKIAISLSLLLTSLAVFGCFSPWKGDEGVISISIGTGSAKAVEWNFEEEDILDFKHIIKLSGGPGPDQERNITGAGIVQFTVTPGNWDITVEGYRQILTDVKSEVEENWELAAIGYQRVNVKAGSNETVPIKMGAPGPFTVTFESNGGNSVKPISGIEYGNLVEVMPDNPVRTGHVFAGWYMDADFSELWYFNEYGVTRDITLYAKWIEGTSVSTWGELKNTIEYGPMQQTIIIINDLHADDTITVKDGRKITLFPLNDITMYRAYDSYTGTFFQGTFLHISNEAGISSNNLILGDPEMPGSLSINGRPEDYPNTCPANSLIEVQGGAILEMYDRVSLLNNMTATPNTNGGAVYIEGGTFNMYGGSIYGNEAPDGYGGGVYVSDYFIAGSLISEGFFMMAENSEIALNNAINGGGVYVYEGKFIMEGGSISWNDAIDGSTDDSIGNGGGVYVYDGEFTMEDGSIYKNTASKYGGGVFANAEVYNTDDSIWDARGRFVKSAGAGTIYGDDEPSLGNTANLGGNAAAATFNSASAPYPLIWGRNITAWPNNRLTSDEADEAGGWETSHQT